ncbi:hypothetical protein [Janthinobacterium sp. JC611]|uniref:hypothetical protein n=1 Tax=Janthinobacterium sp. JC611 TaxID=2816201 RepID=UPI001BFCE731|nr:hypothetical protein [Janthinobacterium sp. JC611]
MKISLNTLGVVSMRLISEMETQLVGGGSFLASDSFDGGGAGGSGGGSWNSVEIVGHSSGPDWGEVGAGAGFIGLGAAIAIGVAAPGALVVGAVVALAYWGGVMIGDGFQGDHPNFP